jgi:hypothetical protein
VLRLDFLLRIYIKTKLNISIKTYDRKPFGDLIRLAEKAGLQADLVKRLRSFNKVRIKGIHRFILGDVTYDELRNALDEDPKIVQDLQQNVVSILPIW